MQRQPGHLMPLETIEPRRLYRQVADQLRSLIDRGEFPIGSRLPTERELASSLGISRPTVREALIALEVDGRVRIRVGSGIYVLSPANTTTTFAPPVAGPFEILAARALIEGAVAEQAARRATTADIAAIDATLARMQDVRVANADADRAFHLAIAAILNNEAITKVVGDLFDQRINPYFARLASYFETTTSWRAACVEHQHIRDCLAAADPTGAAAAMRAHLEQSQARFSSTFGGGAPDTSDCDAADRLRPRPRSVRRAMPKSASTRRKRL
jgi:DNA-binding FadR family transcriptional regulator